RKAERLRSHVIPLQPSRPYSATPKVWGGEGDEKKKDPRTEDKLHQPKRAASAAAQTSLLCGVTCGYKWRALPSEIRPQIKEAVAQDIACRLDVPRTNITTDEYYGDSLIVQTAVEHDGTRTDAELQQSIPTKEPTVNKIVQHKQSEEGFESHLQAKPCEKATLGPELEADSILAPPTKDKQAATEPPPEPQKLQDLEQYNMKATNEMTPTESARTYLRNRLNSLNDTMKRLEKEDGAQMLMALRRLEATTNNRNRVTKRQRFGNLYARTPKHADQTRTRNTMEEAPPQILKQERQTTVNKVTDGEPRKPAEDAEREAAPPLHSTEDIVPADTERELSEPAEDAEREPAPPLHSTEDIVPADTERELTEPAEDAEREAAPPLHSTEDIVPADTERELSEPAEDGEKEAAPPLHS
ncbi:microtubule-associated protein Gb4, putative, partial [Trypanosoma cruzi]